MKAAQCNKVLFSGETYVEQQGQNVTISCIKEYLWSNEGTIKFDSSNMKWRIKRLLQAGAGAPNYKHAQFFVC